MAASFFRNIFGGCLTAAIIAVVVVSCGKDDDLHGIFDLAENCPDSALMVLSKIDKSGLSGKGLADYALAYTWAQDRSGLDVDGDSLIRVAYNYYKGRTELPYYARCMYHMGNYYVNVDSAEYAKFCFKKSIDRSRANKDTLTDCLASNHLSQILILNNIDSAVVLAHYATSMYGSLSAIDTVNLIYYKLNEGVCLNYQQRRKEAMMLCNEALELATAIGNDNTILAACQDMAVVYSDMGKADSALCYAKKAYALRNDDNANNSLRYTLATAYINADSTVAAQRLLRDIEPKTKNEEYSKNYYLLLSHLKDGDNEASQIMRMAFDALENMYKSEMRAKDGHYMSMMQTEREKALAEGKSSMRGAVIILVAFLSVISILFIIYYWRADRERAARKLELTNERNALQKQHQENLNQQKMDYLNELHKQELSHKEMQLSIMKSFIINKVDTFKQLINISDNTSSKVLLSDKDWEDIETYLNGADNLFVSRIRAAYPQLKEKDFRLLMLIRLRIPSKDLAVMYGISEKSIRQNLFLYKGKVGIDGTDMSLRSFIESF